MWRSFFGNMSRGLGGATQKAKMRFLRTSISPIAGFRWSRWPFQDTYAASLDRIQRRMISALMQIKPAPHEGLDDFVKRRHIISGKVATKSGRWSHMWAQSIGKWNDHVQRKHDPTTWSAPLLEWHGPEWLQLQRLIASSSTQESRTNTRAYRGKVHRRWSEGLSKSVTMPDPRCS